MEYAHYVHISPSVMYLEVQTARFTQQCAFLIWRRGEKRHLGEIHMFPNLRDLPNWNENTDFLLVLLGFILRIHITLCEVLTAVWDGHSLTNLLTLPLFCSAPFSLLFQLSHRFLEPFKLSHILIHPPLYCKIACDVTQEWVSSRIASSADPLLAPLIASGGYD